jgi:DNA-binding MarR family transcriptional regulator
MMGMDRNETSELLAKISTHLRSGIFGKISRFSKGEALVLNYLIERDAPAQPSELSSAMNIVAARIAVVLRSLEEKGCVTRRMNLEDRRKIIVTITEEGKRRAMREKEEIFSFLQEVFDEMGDEEAEKFVKSLDKFLETARQVLESMEERQ